MASMNFNTANQTFRHLMGNGLETLDSVEVVKAIREALKR